MSLDGLSLSPLVAELNNRLAGGRIDRIFQPDKQTLILWVRQARETLKLLVSVSATHPHIHLADTVPDNPAAPPVFCMLLRKHLEDGRIGEVRQHGDDRIITIDFDVRVEQGLIATKQLIIELMGKHSNIIFVYNDVIIDSIRRVNVYMSRHRQVLPGKPYILPPSQDRLSLLTTAPAAIAAQATSSQGQLVKTLIASVSGMGPITSREILWRSGLPPDISAHRLDNADQCALTQAIEEMAALLQPDSLQPTVAVGEHGELAAIAAFPLCHLTKAQLHSFATMSEAVAFADTLSGVRKTPLHESMLKLVQAEISRLGRKKTLLEAELREATESNTFRHYADTLMIHLHEIPAGKAATTLPDLFAEKPNATVVIALDPLLTPLANAQRYYAKYNKLERRLFLTDGQLQECISEINYLDTVAFALESSASSEELEEVRLELVASGYLIIKTKPRKVTGQPVFTPWQLTVDTTTILIGKNNRQNDWLTFKVAHPDDIWLHTKDIPGSHVIIRCNGSTPSSAVLTTAAKCAAWFSKARASSNIPVDYTRRRYVKKPSGAKPGFVIYEKQQTLYVTPNGTDMEELLKG